MSVVIKQSIQNTIITYIGFAIGAINTLFLFTEYLSKEEYGVVTYAIAASNMLWPTMIFGFHNTIIKYFKKFQLMNQHRQFFTWVLFVSSLVISVLFVLLVLNQNRLEAFYETNPSLKKAIYPIFFLAVAFAYFEIFYAWARVHMRSVEGNFLKQIFNRTGMCVLLILVALDLIEETQFLYGLVIISSFRTLLMLFIAFKIELPSIHLVTINYSKDVIVYSLVILVAVMVSVFLLELDKVMIERYLPVEEVAVYSIMVYIASVIEVPLKSMMQITTPLTSSYLEEKKMDKLSALNTSTSITTLIVGGVIALLIFSNVETIYAFISNQYQLHLQVLFLICIIKLLESSLGVTSAILYNSDYYKWLLLFGVVVTVIAILLNSWLIPIYGLKGAAIASLSVYIIYDAIKLFWVKKSFGLQPYNKGFFKLIGIIVLLGFFFRSTVSFFPENLFGLIIRSILILVSYGALVYFNNISKPVNVFLRSQWVSIKNRIG